MKPRALDLFCGAGGATKGLQRAGFHVTGVDIKPQPRYCGDAFFQADALEFPLEGYDFIWASPPCHDYSTGTQHRKNAGINYPRLIEPTRERISAIGPYCIENVPGAYGSLLAPSLLCGGMFGLRIVRHRLFETNWPFVPPVHLCNSALIDRDVTSVTRHGPPARWYRKNPGASFSVKVWHDAMGIDWMDRGRLTQAIPPAYSEFIGKQAMQFLNRDRDVHGERRNNNGT